MTALHTIYLHPELSLQCPILCSRVLVNNDSTRRGKEWFTFQELEGRHCTVQSDQHTRGWVLGNGEPTE